MSMRNRALALFFCLSVVLVACSDEDGSTGADMTMCEVTEGEGCYWMVDDGSACWVPAPPPDATTFERCRDYDSCREGGGEESAGGCYKWSDGSDGVAQPWP